MVIVPLKKKVNFQRIVNIYPKDHKLKLEHQGKDATDYVLLYCIQILHIYCIYCIYSNNISTIGLGAM